METLVVQSYRCGPSAHLNAGQSGSDTHVKILDK